MILPNEVKKTEWSFKEFMIRLPIFPLAVLVILTALLLPLVPLFVAVYGLLKLLGY